MRSVKALWLIAAVLGLAVAGCRISGEAEADPVGFSLDREFGLGGGQEAVLGDESLRLRFTDVLEDSRCPTEVECFWTGQARLAVLVEPADSPSTTVNFNTNPAPGQNVQTAEAGGYTIMLKSLDPYPKTPDDPISLVAYRATLLVSKGA